MKKKTKSGFEVARTDENGVEYTKDGLRIEGDYDLTWEDQMLSGSLAWASCRLTIPGAVPNAWKIDTPLIQAYEIPEFFTPEECQKTIDIVNQNLYQSSVTNSVTGSTTSTYRTSRTNFIEEVDLDWAMVIDSKICKTLGVNPKYSEGTQGQRYDENQYFKEHLDWFPPEEILDPEGDPYLKMMGQRTWTFMVYLNTVEEGGETFFRRINRKFIPRQGTAVVWNNLYPDGHGNPFTIHEAMPVTKGNKWVITKWFREQKNPDHWNFESFKSRKSKTE